MSSIPLHQLLNKVPHETEERVKRAREAMRSVIQELLRSECRLQPRTDREQRRNEPVVQMTVNIVAGLPDALCKVTFDDNLALCLILGRHRYSLEQAKQGLADVEELLVELQCFQQVARMVQAGGPAAQATKQLVESLLNLLEKEDPLKQILGVAEDVLGAYFYRPHGRFTDRQAKPPRIELYGRSLDSPPNGWL